MQFEEKEINTLAHMKYHPNDNQMPKVQHRKSSVTKMQKALGIDSLEVTHEPKNALSSMRQQI